MPARGAPRASTTLPRIRRGSRFGWYSSERSGALAPVKLPTPRSDEIGYSSGRTSPCRALQQRSNVIGGRMPLDLARLMNMLSVVSDSVDGENPPADALHFDRYVG